MKTISTLIGCALVSLSTAHAANIAWVSFHAGDNAPGAGAAGLGFTQAPDIGYTQLLSANGHTVTRFVTKNDPVQADADFLNGFDLVIIGRSVDSANYQQGNELAFWHSTITRPVINMSGYTLRSSRLGFTTGTTIPDTAGTVGLEALVPSHPIFNGVALGAGNVMVNSYAGIQTFGTNTQRGISVNTDALAAGGTALARIATAGDPALNGMVIGEWAAGAVIYGTNTLSNRRLVFLSGSREHAAAPTSSQIAGIYDLSADGQLMFLNAVNYMASPVPEPSTYLLLGFGALALLWRWKRS